MSSQLFVYLFGAEFLSCSWAFGPGLQATSVQFGDVCGRPAARGQFGAGGWGIGFAQGLGVDLSNVTGGFGSGFTLVNVVIIGHTVIVIIQGLLIFLGDISRASRFAAIEFFLVMTRFADLILRI